MVKSIKKKIKKKKLKKTWINKTFLMILTVKPKVLDFDQGKGAPYKI